MKDIILNLKYPTQGWIQGKVYVSFDWFSSRKKNVEIAKMLSEEFNKEVIRVLKLLDI